MYIYRLLKNICNIYNQVWNYFSKFYISSIYIYIYIYIYTIIFIFIFNDCKFLTYKIWLAQAAGTVEYTDCISAKEQDSPNECPGMTLNNLTVKLQ